MAEVIEEARTLVVTIVKEAAILSGVGCPLPEFVLGGGAPVGESTMSF